MTQQIHSAIEPARTRRQPPIGHGRTTVPALVLSPTCVDIEGDSDSRVSGIGLTAAHGDLVQ
ncbi:hypothetical protein [Nocardia rhizosphaerihabitans]|nr:hypothetical protein [Nocardia rhizosphaerihabitans]